MRVQHHFYWMLTDAAALLSYFVQCQEGPNRGAFVTQEQGYALLGMLASHPAWA